MIYARAEAARRARESGPADLPAAEPVRPRKGLRFRAHLAVLLGAGMTALFVVWWIYRAAES